MMAEIKIHVFHTGEACVAPDLPFGGEHCSTIKASGAFAKKSERLWLPVSAYLIECSHGKIIFDCGWHRNMSPDGVFDKKAQIKSLGSLPLYVTNQGRIEKGLAIDEQLAALGIHPADLDLVLLSHLDCDHTNGLNLVADAKQILVSKDELLFAENKTPVNRIRYNADWWRSTKMQTLPSLSIRYGKEGVTSHPFIISRVPSGSSISSFSLSLPAGSMSNSVCCPK